MTAIEAMEVDALLPIINIIQKLQIMKLTSLDSFESLNSQEIQCIIGGTVAVSSECWSDSTSRDSYKKDTGGCSKRRDKPSTAIQ